MSDDWKSYAIAELVEEDRPICYGVLKPGDYCDQGVPLIRIVDVEGDRLREDQLFRISPALDREFYRSKLVGGEIVVSIQGTIGRVAIIPPELSGANISRTLARLAIKPVHSSEFVRFTLLSEAGQRLLGDAVMGTTRDSLNIGALRKISIRLPLADEQQRIAEILSTVDEAIEQTEALVGKWQQMKAGLMHDLFTRGVTPDGHLRPALTQAPHLYQKSPLGWIPKEWEPGLLSDYLDPNSGIKPGPFGSSLTKDIYTTSGFRIYGQEQVIGGNLEAGDYYISAYKFAEMRAFEVLEGDVLLSLVGTIGCVLVVEAPFEPGIINPRLIRLRPISGKTLPRFVRHLLLTDGIRRQIDSLAGGGTMPVINGKVIRRLRVPLIDFEEQTRIDERLDALEQSSISASTHLAKLLQQKQGLMHDLLTGRVRVKVH